MHKAASLGCPSRVIALLAMTSIDIDQGNSAGKTPLMYAAHHGHSSVARILLNRGADVSVQMDHGFCALHLAAQDGHHAVVVDLLKAGADVETRTSEGATAIGLAAQRGHFEATAALIKAGANVDSSGRQLAWATPISLAASKGHVLTVRELLGANANPLLSRSKKISGEPSLPLDDAAFNGHSEVVRELIKQVGIKGCGGATGGGNALQVAAQSGQVETMATLMDAGVVDTGAALVNAAGWGGEAAVKFLLQRRQLAGSRTGVVEYVNFRDRFGLTALFRSFTCIDDTSSEESEVVLRLVSPRVARLLVDAGADTTSEIQATDDVNFGTPLAFINECLLEKKIREFDATEEQMYRLEAVRSLLLRVEAVRAVSWLWHCNVPSVIPVAGGTSRITTATTTASGNQLGLMLPIMRRRRRGTLLAPLLRWVLVVLSIHLRLLLSSSWRGAGEMKRAWLFERYK